MAVKMRDLRAGITVQVENRLAGPVLKLEQREYMLADHQFLRFAPAAAVAQTLKPERVKLTLLVNLFSVLNPTQAPLSAKVTIEGAPLAVPPLEARPLETSQAAATQAHHVQSPEVPGNAPAPGFDPFPIPQVKIRLARFPIGAAKSVNKDRFIIPPGGLLIMLFTSLRVCPPELR